MITLEHRQWELPRLRMLRDQFARRFESELLTCRDRDEIREDIETVCYGPAGEYVLGYSWNYAIANLEEDCAQVLGGHYCIQAAETAVFELVEVVKLIHAREQEECAVDRRRREGRVTTETIFLLIERRKRYSYRGALRIAKISRKRPDIVPGQALVKILVTLPDGVLQPPECRVEIKPEHIAQAPVKVES